MNRNAPRSIDQYLRQLREERRPHTARGIGRPHAGVAKALLVDRAGA